MAKLAKLPVIESAGGTLVAHSTLRHVEQQFTDRHGKPFTLWGNTNEIYLSTRYPEHVINALCSIGVDNLTDEGFVDDLERMVLEDEAHVRAQPEEWHSDLARALIPLTENDHLKAVLQRLPIIPILNGKWITASSGPRVFPDDSEVDVGDFLVLRSIRIIQPAATGDANRRHLWSCLDIQNINRQEICQYIVDVQAHPASHSDLVKWADRAHLVAHTKFFHRQTGGQTSSLIFGFMIHKEYYAVA